MAVLLLGALPAPAFGFTGFSNLEADATFGEQMTFSVDLAGGAPDELELLMRFTGSDSTQVAPVQPNGDQATYVWDAAERYVVPNTEVAYQWRATDDGRTTLSAEASLLYDDDRPGLDWQSAVIGDATVHWYGGNEEVARHMGELSAGGAAQAEQLLGHELDGPVDIFVYDAREDFFGALGPGAREWFGAATFPPLRTTFMWLGAGPASYLDTTIVHEVTHIVFSDSTENPFHEPAKWLNEGLATWAEARSADDQHATVESEASGGGLFSFDAIAYNFPFGGRGTTLSYAMGTTMVDMIIDDYGEDAIARIAGAYRAGASDDEALQDGTGVPADQMYANYYDALRRRRARSGRGGSHPAIQCRQAGQRPGSGRVRGRVAAGVVQRVSAAGDGRGRPDRCRRRRGRPGDPEHRRVRRLVGPAPWRERGAVVSAVASRGGRRFRIASTWGISIAVALAVVGFIGAMQWNSSLARDQFTTSAQQVLAGQVTALEAEQDLLRQQIGAANAQVQQLQQQSTGSSVALEEVNRQLTDARLKTGLMAVRGPGVMVEIADSKRVVPPGENPSSFIVLVDDLRDIVTALWASGAEAISINGERLVATSSIYGVGASVLVNTAFLSPPFQIEAIGSDGLLERFQSHPAFLGRVAQRIDFFGLEFASQVSTDLTLPPFIGSTRFRWAVPSEEAP